MTPDRTLTRTTTAAFIGLFATIAVLGLLLFPPRQAPVRHVAVAPGGKIGLRAEALHIVMPAEGTP